MTSARKNPAARLNTGEFSRRSSPSGPWPVVPGQTWDGLVLAVSRDRLLLGPEGAALLVSLIAMAAAVARRSDGIARVSPQLAQLRRVAAPIAAAAVSGPRPTDMDGDLDLPASSVMGPITAPEAARLLGISDRHAGRLADAGAFGPVCRVGRVRQLERAEVLAYRKTTRQETGR